MTSLIYDIGTVTLTNGSTEIVGVGTAWAVNLVKGGVMTVEVAGGNPLPLASVEDDEAATAAIRWMGPSGTYSYAIALASSQAAETVWATRQWARVVGDALLAGIVPDASGTEVERDALDPPLTNGQWFALAEPDSDLVLQLKVPGGWRSFATRGAQGPTGIVVGAEENALIEIGSNANGSYARFAGGLQVCWHILPESGSITQASGNIFLDTASQSWTYPASFNAAPTLSGFARRVTGSGAVWVLSVGNAGTTASVGQVRVAGSMSGSTGQANMIAIGRWTA